MENKELYNDLTKLVNATFGTTGPGASYKSGQKVNLILRNDEVLEAKYVSLVTFTSDKNIDSLLHKIRNEAYALIEAALKKLSADYKEQYNKKISFEVKTDTASENVDYAHYNIYNSTRRAFFKLNCLVQIKPSK
jgi:hypothetical protein